MKKALLIFITVLIASLSIVPSIHAQESALTILGIDDTGSYSLRAKAPAIGQFFVNSMKPGDVLYIRRITDQSYADTCSVLRLEMPKVGNAPENKFNRRAQAEWQGKQRQLTALKAQANAILADMKPLKAKRTDIWSFFAAAAVRLQAEPGDRVRRIILISDMKDNMNRRVNIDLMGAEVFVVGFECGTDPDAAQKLQAFWVQALKDCNAGGVYFLPPDTKLTFAKH